MTDYGPGDRVIVKSDQAYDAHGVVVPAEPDAFQRERGWTVAVRFDKQPRGLSQGTMLFAAAELEPES